MEGRARQCRAVIQPPEAAWACERVLGVRREMPRHVFTSPLNPEAEFLFQEPRVRE